MLFGDGQGHYPRRVSQANNEVIDGPLPADGIDLLVLLAYSEQTAFLRLADDATTSDNPAQKLSHTFLAGRAFTRFEKVCARITQMNGDPEALLSAIDGAFDGYESRTPAEKWHERVLKGYIGREVANDFCRLAMTSLEPDLREFFQGILDDSSATDAEFDIIAKGCKEDPILASRLALWARRIMGELLNQIQELVMSIDALERLVVAGADQAGTDITVGTAEESKKLKISWIFSRLTAEHARRMDRLGLAA